MYAASVTLSCMMKISMFLLETCTTSTPLFFVSLKNYPSKQFFHFDFNIQSIAIMGSNSRTPNYIRYVPAQEGAQPKIIRMVEVQKDPMEPAKFKLNQKIPGPPPSPPAPVMHSPPRKITAEEQSKWKIPPCVSSWKNPRGYTVPLDKRCAFNGRNGAQPETINPNFAKLSEALEIHKKAAKERLEEEAKHRKLMAQKEKEEAAENLRLLAKKAREERALVSRSLLHGRDDDSEDEDAEEVKERERIREEIHRNGVRNANRKASAPGKRTNLDRQRERDISEQIALGMARPNTQDNDVHDQRLYNNSQGLGSGFGEDDDYAVYDKAWKTQASFSTNYRPSADVMQESRDRDVADKLLPQTSGAPGSSEQLDDLAPIQFDQDSIEAVFKIDSFLKSAKYKANNTKAQQESQSSKRRKY